VVFLLFHVAKANSEKLEWFLLGGFLGYDKKPTASRLGHFPRKCVPLYAFIIIHIAMSRFLYFFVCACAATNLTAQSVGLCHQVLASSGGTGTQGGRLYTYTVGEPFILTLSTPNRVITQGFHQPDLCVPVSTQNLDLEAWALEVFPNPTAHQVSIRYAAGQNGQLVASVFDLLGRPVLLNQRLGNPEGSLLDSSGWQAGIYLLRLQEEDSQRSATLRIVRL
jgi:hypothetical protein